MINALRERAKLYVLRHVIGLAKELPMFGTHGVARIIWNQVEDDFVLGACSRRIIGFTTLSADGQWTAFDGDSGPLASFEALEDAKSALWDAHRTDLARKCEPSSWPSVWARFSQLLPHPTSLR